MHQQIFTDASFHASDTIVTAIEKLMDAGYIIDSFSYTDSLKDYVIVAHKQTKTK